MPTGRGTPYKSFTHTPEAPDTKARLSDPGAYGSGYPEPGNVVPSEPLKMVNQDNNGMNQRKDVRAPLNIGVSKPKSTPNGSIGGPLE